MTPWMMYWRFLEKISTGWFKDISRGSSCRGFWKKIAGWNSGRIDRGISGRISAEISEGVPETILDKIFEEITNIIPEAFPRGIWDLKSMLSSHVILSESFSGACRIVYQDSLLT